MANEFHPISFEQLLAAILKQTDIEVFSGFHPGAFSGKISPALQTSRFNQVLDSPLGVAAGPHSQLAQNIVAAWLHGARYIELKTVQTLDELNVSKPCIDMQDEGYNCEWSQELKIQESFDQYLNAWVLVHVLNHKLFARTDPGAGTIFNMSVGYNMEGILHDNVQWFFRKMDDCQTELKARMEIVKKLYPDADKLNIPAKLSDSVTLSTMHGCPPEEIEKIALYLIRQKKLHTLIKLNPTLLGPEMLRWILNGKLGFTTSVPDEAFAHDLKYNDALVIIRNLKEAAESEGVFFGLKLTNTLESENKRGVLPGNEKMNYMSGRALHPVSVHLAAKLQAEFDGLLDISFSAGADAFNIADLLSCGLSPVTVCSDVLKPGGYGRLSQYLKNIEAVLEENQVGSLVQFMCLPGKMRAVKLKDYTSEALENSAYRKAMRDPMIKTLRSLNSFDCIHAPCVSTCPTNQNIPQYLYYVSKGEFRKAFEVILQTNPLPSVTGAVCDHDCQTRCTRINYDESIAIREVKRWVTETDIELRYINTLPKNGFQATVIGCGPAGLSCAYFLLLNGFEVDIYEEKNMAGGMVADVIPLFRLRNEALRADIERIENMGARIHYGVKVDKTRFDTWIAEKRFVFIATGTPRTKKLAIPGEQAGGVADPLAFLSELKKGTAVLPGKRVLVVGGGNTAMDVARAVKRMQGSLGTVIVVYRRRMADMPAESEEILAAQAEGVLFAELKSPVEIVVAGGKAGGLKVISTRPAGIGSDGREQVEIVPGSEEILIADAIFPAVGQQAELDFIDPSVFIKGEADCTTNLLNVFMGGDVRKGPANIVSAIAEGKKAAMAIMKAAGVTGLVTENEERHDIDFDRLMLKKFRREKSLLVDSNKAYPSKIIHDADEAVREASRCLMCDKVCNICVTVCPNLANQYYNVEPFSFDSGDFHFAITQNTQTYNIGEFCNECGNCRTFCPTSGAPYQDKPRVWLTKEAFEKADSGYHFSKENGYRILYHKQDANVSSLRQTDHGFDFRKKETLLQFDVQWNLLSTLNKEVISEALGMRTLWGI